MLKSVRSYIVRRGAGRDDADDIIQEAFARLEAYTQAKEVCFQEAFLRRTALNLMRDRARRAKSAPFDNVAVELDSVADAHPQPDEIVRGRERLRRVQSGIDRLDAQSRRCLLGRRLDELSYAQIAERENLTVGAVEKRVARAILFLTQWMDGW